MKPLFLRSYSTNNVSRSSLLPYTVSSKNWTDSAGLISGLFVVAYERVLKEITLSAA